MPMPAAWIEHYLRKYTDFWRQSLARLDEYLVSLPRTTRRTMMSVIAPGTSRHVNGELVITRHYNAPRELVFRMWTEAEHFSRWFGPTNGSVPHCTVRPAPAEIGSEMHFCVQVPPGDGAFSGETVWGKWIFRELVPPERIAFDDYFADEQGNIVERPGFPNETDIRVSFEEHANGTKMTLYHELEVDHGESDGWRVGFDRLQEYLESQQRG